MPGCRPAATPPPSPVLEAPLPTPAPALPASSNPDPAAVAQPPVAKAPLGVDLVEAARKKAEEWMSDHLPKGYPMPDTVEEALELKAEYKRPVKIFVDYNQKFPRIISRIYENN